MTRRLMTIVAMLCGGLALMAAPAAAQDDSYELDDTTVLPSSEGRIVIEGTCEGAPSITFEVRGGNPPGSGPVLESGTIPVEDDDTFSGTTEQSYPNGRYEVAIQCGDDTMVLNVNVNRGQAIAPGQRRDLPVTGAESSVPLARLGVILVAAGGVALYAGKKRNGRRAAFIAN